MDDRDPRAARVAARQHGLVARGQLLELGLSRDQIRERVAGGLLAGLHRGVYRHAAAPLTAEGRLLAAVLACGADAVASHRSAGRLRDLRGVGRSRPEITVVGTAQPMRPGTVVHRTDRLDPVDRTSVGGVPVTSVARTLLDLGAVVPYEVVELATQDALLRGLVQQPDLLAVLERVGGRGRRGTAALRAVLRAGLPPDRLESRLEALVHRLLADTGCAPPALQYQVGELRLDFAWPERRLAVEADGRRWHSTGRDFRRDLARRNHLAALGWTVFHVGWADVHERPAEVAAMVRAALA